MPRLLPPKTPPTLREQCKGLITKALHKAVKSLGHLWKVMSDPPYKLPTIRRDPSGTTWFERDWKNDSEGLWVEESLSAFAPTGQEHLELDVRAVRVRTEAISRLREWLTTMPMELVEEVLDETDIFDDVDEISAMKRFGDHGRMPLYRRVQAFLELLGGMKITRLGGKEEDHWLWYCGWVTGADYLQNKLCWHLSFWTSLRHLDLAYLATDRMCYLISCHLPNLFYLSLKYSRSLSDDGVIALVGGRAPQTQLAKAGPDNSHSIGVFKLRHLDLSDCENVTASAVWFAILRLPELTIIRPGKNTSVAEVLLEKCGQLSEEEVKNLRLKLTHFKHSYCPLYQDRRLSVSDELMEKVIRACPNLIELDVVTKDGCLRSFSGMKSLNSVKINFEDGLSVGLFELLKNVGSQLENLKISIIEAVGLETDPAETHDREFVNVVLRLARGFCPNLRRLKVRANGQSKGLISEELFAKVSSELPELSDLRQLEYMMLDAGEDQICDEKLLLETLQGCPEINYVWLAMKMPFMNDEFIGYWISRNRLNNLTELFFDPVDSLMNLTYKSVSLVMGLESIHELNVYMWNLTKEEREMWKNEVAVNGWDIVMH